MSSDIKLLSWNAILAAAIAGVGLNFLLNLLSLSIGISIFTQQPDGIVLSALGFLGFILVAVISMFITGWLAGILTISAMPKIWGIYYGFIAWCICFILTVILLTNMIQFASFHSHFTSKELIGIKITNEFTAMQTETKLPNSELNKEIITINGYITFALFLTGAISSCFGGWVGYNPQRKKHKT